MYINIYIYIYIYLTPDNDILFKQGVAFCLHLNLYTLNQHVD